MIFNNPFRPFLAVDNDDDAPRRSRQDPFRPFTTSHLPYDHDDDDDAPVASVVNLEKRVAMSARALEQAERDLAAARKRASADDAKELAAQIIHAGEVRRGLADAPVTAGPKRFVKATAELILAEGRKARGESTK